MAKIKVAIHIMRLNISELNVFEVDIHFCMYFNFSIQFFNKLSSCNDLHRLFVVVLPLR